MPAQVVLCQVSWGAQDLWRHILLFFLVKHIAEMTSLFFPPFTHALSVPLITLAYTYWCFPHSPVPVGIGRCPLGTGRLERVRSSGLSLYLSGYGGCLLYTSDAADEA